MSMWQYVAAIEGWMRVHANQEEGSGPKISDAQTDEIWKWMQEKQDVPLTAMRH